MPMPHPCPPWSAALALAGLLALGPQARAAPYRPASDSAVVERLPTRATDPVARELAALRAHWRRNPRDVDPAVALAQRYFELAAADGDPRYVGYAQAALQPWWDAPAPPPTVRVMRAVLLQFDHRFDAALADLEAVVRVAPDNAAAWSWLAAIHMVRADYAPARRACAGLAPLAPALIATGCTAYIDALTGQAAAAANALRAGLRSRGDTTPAQRLWALTRLAETEALLGHNAAAEAAFRDALALDLADTYLQAAYADHLLDRGRPAEVLTLLAAGARADVLLLRLAIAAKAVHDPRAAGWARELAARFDAARARGSTAHRKEEARFALAVLGQTERALALAQDNYAEQREVADARLLLEAALAAGQPTAAEPVLRWRATSRFEGVHLKALAARARARP